jgi:hypothetical protein
MLFVICRCMHLVAAFFDTLYLFKVAIETSCAFSSDDEKMFKTQGTKWCNFLLFYLKLSKRPEDNFSAVLVTISSFPSSSACMFYYIIFISTNLIHIMKKHFK